MGGLLVGVGVLLFSAAGLYQLLVATGFFNAQWGLLGVIAFWLLPPLWVAAPFVMWAVSGVFPALYFAVWVGGWIGGGALVAAGQAVSSHGAGARP